MKQVKLIRISNHIYAAVQYCTCVQTQAVASKYCSINTTVKTLCSSRMSL